MPSIMGFIRKYPVAVYFILAFAISWGGFVLVVGPGGFPGLPEKFEAMLPSVAFAMLAGPSIASILLIGLIDGASGLRELMSKLLRWRVSALWYALALLVAPVLTGGLLLAFSLTSPIFTSPDTMGVLFSGIFAGLSIVLEEIGWTGFAVPRLRQRYGILSTGLIVGILWGAWHFLQVLWVGGTYSGGIPVYIFVPLSLLSSIVGLTAYRVLLVWLYDRTSSLLLVTLMHASLTATNVIIFRPDATGFTFLAYGWALNAAMWVVVAAAYFLGGRFRENKNTDRS